MLIEINSPTSNDSETYAASMGYTSIVEAEYSSESAELIKALRHFEQIKNKVTVFTEFEADTKVSRERSYVIGNMWYVFSAFMPWFLCHASSLVSSNEKRHYVIQTAFEELGMRDVREIHSEMFLSAFDLTGLASENRDLIRKNEKFLVVMNKLRSRLLDCSNDEQVLGILLGLELPAEENIETVLSSLVFSREMQILLEQHKFFRLHREIEAEHVRLTVSNALRFCPTELQKESFMIGLNSGLEFWREFWNCGSVLTQEIDQVGLLS